MKSWFLVAALTLAASHDAAAQYANYAYSPQDILTGANVVHAGGVTGAGVTFGIIDTGIAAPWTGFGGRVTATPVSACVIANCNQSLAVTDDNGHGTFVASEIIGSIPNAGFVGIAPGAKAVAIKVLDASGSGSYTDVANGIVTAVNKGAQVLNLSLGPFLQNASLVAAINYAASKGAYVVFAGGNSAAALNNNVNITGLTDAAIQRLVFVGSTNAQKKISSFSNTPGTGGFVSTTGKFTAYDAMWMMADGEDIWGASNYHTAQYGYSYITQMSGTSMAAPQAAGAIGLLVSRWNFLLNTGTAPAILEQTAQRLGTNNGVNTTYGDGFLRVDLAFQPIGALQVPVNGKLTPVGNAQISASTPFGTLPKLSAAFVNAVAYDSFQRDFAVALASSIAGKSTGTGSTVATAQVLGQSGGAARSFTDLGHGSWFASSFSGTPTAPLMPSMEGHNNPGLIQDPSRPQFNDWSLGFSQQGTYVGLGQGSNVALAMSDARWGGQTAFFNGNTDMSGALLGLVPGANFGAVGMKLGDRSRVFFGMLSANGDTLTALSPEGMAAKGAAMGYTMEPKKGWKVSFTASALNEKNMMLGSTSSGYLGLSPTALTASFGIGTNIDLGEGYQLGFDGSMATTDATHNSNSLITNTSRLTSGAFGMAFSKAGLVTDTDTLGAGIRKPMRIYAGTATAAVPTGTDAFGNPIVTSMRASLVPSGSETDFQIGYDRPLGTAMSTGLSLVYRHDADNVAKARDAAALVKFKAGF